MLAIWYPVGPALHTARRVSAQNKTQRMADSSYPPLALIQIMLKNVFSLSDRAFKVDFYHIHFESGRRWSTSSVRMLREPEVERNIGNQARWSRSVSPIPRSRDWGDWGDSLAEADAKVKVRIWNKCRWVSPASKAYRLMYEQLFTSVGARSLERLQRIAQYLTLMELTSSPVVTCMPGNGITIYRCELRVLRS